MAENSDAPQGQEPPTPSPQLSRRPSKASDRFSALSLNTLPFPPQITPEPAYIASSAAAHVVSNSLANRGTAFAGDEDQDDETAAKVTPSALVLLNSFLDQLLYSFLANSRSTSILSLKPAIAEILKPRLAKEAIDGADEELRGYMAGGDDEELLDFHNGQELKGGSNLHHIFRRTRLRCMVYTRLGDLEEEDEEAYLEAESPQEGKQNRLSRDFGNVSPAAAIFLTSIIEFIGEQALMIAGENAAGRHGSKRESGTGSLMVEQHDVEKIAFNKTLGRLWRSWKKAARTTSMISSRPLLAELRSRKTVSEGASRATSISEYGDGGYFSERLRRQDSINEHEVTPGRNIPPQAIDLPAEPDFGEGSEVVDQDKATQDRPRSISGYEFPPKEDKEEWQAKQADTERQTRGLKTGPKSRRRASSLPAAKTTPYSSPTEESFTTPTEEPRKKRSRDSASQESESRTEEKAEAEKQPDEYDHGMRTMDHGLMNRDSIMHRDLKPIPIDPSLASRGVSMSEYSDDVVEENEAAMTPQALKFSKTSPTKIDSSAAKNEQINAESPSRSSYRPLDADDDEERGVFPPRSSKSKGIPENLASVRGEPLASYNKREKDVKRDIPVLYEAASNDDVVYTQPKRSPKPGATINDSNDLMYGDPAAFQAVEDQQAINNTQRLDTRQAPTSAPGSERAAVQRVHHSPTSTRDSPTAAGRASSSSTRDTRPITSNSGTSQVSSKIKGIINRDSSDAQRQAGTSSDITREMTGGSSMSGRSSDKEQDFEQLIRSDETIQYTLTPQNMRDIEYSDSPRYTTKPPPHPIIVPPGNNRSLSATQPSKPPKGVNGLRSNPTAEDPNVMEFASSQTASNMKMRAPPAVKPHESSKQGPLAREAPRDDDSTRDFADFIRSTGPENDSRAAAKGAQDRPSIQRLTSGGSQASGSRPPSRKITKPQPTVTSKKSESNLPNNKGSFKLKARDPIASPTNTTSELADFFRSSAPDGGQRSVSQPLASGRGKEQIGSAPSVASTQDSFAASRMTQSSTNSRTALLDASNRAPAKRQQEPGGPVRKQRRVKDPYAIDISDDEIEQQYAEPQQEPVVEEISLADFLKNSSPPNSAKDSQQSRQPQPPSLSGNIPVEQSPPNNKKKAAGVSMRERIARNIAVIPDYRPIPPKAPKKTSSPRVSPPSSNERRPAHRTNSNTSTHLSRATKPQPQKPIEEQPTAPQLPALKSMDPKQQPAARPMSPHLTQNGKVSDTLRPTQPTYSAARAASSRPKMVARAEAASSGGGMSDLANFLRETEPPTGGGMGPGMGGPPGGGKAAKMMGGMEPARGVNGAGNGGTRTASPAAAAKSGSEGGRWKMFGKKK